MLHVAKIQKADMYKYDVCFCGDFKEDLKEFMLFSFLHFPCLRRVSHFQSTVFNK